jgi:hypothetical protein
MLARVRLYFDKFAHPSVSGEAFLSLMTYMSTQKLRTPKGLAWLQSFSRQQDLNITLNLLQRVRDLFCATWAEGVWQLADAPDGQGFIISDHPVTAYNRACPPLSAECRQGLDPDIRMCGTHTYFPLSPRRVLILTNLSWVRNPYQSEKKFRPNPKYFRDTVFDFSEIQTGRILSVEEVLQIKLITKKRARRYIAAAREEWLYPELILHNDHWMKMGNGYLLMPEPRSVYMGGQIYIGYNDGRKDAFGEYGHKPWQRGFQDRDRVREETASLEKCKAEFALMLGPDWRGSSYAFMRGGPHKDSEDMTEHYRDVRKRLSRRRRY